MSYELHKAYVPTKNKKCVMPFKNKKPSELMTYNQVKSLPEFAGILNDETILVDIDEKEQFELLLDIVEDQQLRCRVYQSTRGGHFLFKNTSVESCKTHTKLACGLEADIKVGKKNSYSVLKFANKERKILYDILEGEDYEQIPSWILPIKSDVDLLNMEEGDGRNQALFNHILTLQKNGLTKEETKDTLRIINKYILSEPMSDNELEVIMRDEAFIPEDEDDNEDGKFFSSKGAFLFDKFAKFLIKEHNIIKIDNQLFAYKDGVYVNGNEEIESLMIDHVSRLNKQKRKEVLSYIDLLIRKNTTPSSANLIAFKNGIYDLEENAFAGFDPNIIITNKINFNYNENAYDENTDKALNKMACGDNNIRLLLEEMIGYCFYRRNELRKAFVMTGDKRGGKSTFLSVLQKLLGDDNTCALDLNELSDRFKTAELYMKLANIGDDIGDEFIPNPAVFKKVVSGERLNVERKGQDPFDFNPYAKQLFSANDIPRIKDRGAVVDRLVIVPFNAKFDKSDSDYDPFIKYKMLQDSSMEYLIQIGLDALFGVLDRQGFTTSDKAQKALQEYEENNNPILTFFNESNEDDFENQPTKFAYQKYQEFCISNSLQALSNIEFSKQVKKYYGYDIVNKSIKGKKYRVFVRA